MEGKHVLLEDMDVYVKSVQISDTIWDLVKQAAKRSLVDERVGTDQLKLLQEIAKQLNALIKSARINRKRI